MPSGRRYTLSVPSRSMVGTAQPRDPFAVLSDLEITLILSFLSIEETISIRRVSKLWKSCVEFRLSKGAIGRHFPRLEEAEATYSGWEEEASTYLRMAHFYGTLAKPNIARKFTYNPRSSQAWCICNHHMVWVDPSHINIQRLWDPENPACEKFPLKRKDLSIHFEGKPWNHNYLQVRWMAGDDQTGIVVLYFGVPGKYDMNSRWLLAVSVTTRKFLWNQKHSSWIQKPDQPRDENSYETSPPMSFGHGRLCFVESLRFGSSTVPSKLVIMNIITGEIEANEPMPDDHLTLSPTLSNHKGVRFATHPTKKVYFLIMGQELWVFSTSTAKLLGKCTIPGISQDSSNCYFRFGKNIGGVGEQTWLLSETSTSIIGHEIELEQFQVTRQRAWSFAHNENCIEKSSQREWRWDKGRRRGATTHLDPVSNVAYVYEEPEYWGPTKIVAVTFELAPRTPGETGTLDYRIKSCEYVTLPPKKKLQVKKRGRKGKTSVSTLENNNVNKLAEERRPFALPRGPSRDPRRYTWVSNSYLAMDNHPPDNFIYVLGCVPRG